MRTRTRSVPIRVLAATAAVAVAALVAAGCGGGGADAGGSGDTGLVGDEGPLAWLPEDTWLVATANLDPAAIDTAVESLDRLPIWALAEGFLPASDGPGLRRELLELVAQESASTEGGTPRTTAKELEAAFGDRVGFAITSADFESFEDDAAPFVAWAEVDDEDQALAAARDLFDGTDAESEHAGVTYFSSKDDDATFLVRDGLLVVSTTPKRMEALIDVRDGDDSLAGDDVAAAVLEVGVGDALAGFALASEPLLDAVPELVRTQADSVGDDGEATSEAKRRAERAAKVADELGPLLESNAVDGLIADWIGGSVTIDETGLRVKGAWSNPRELADPDPGSRELVERMPVDAPIVNAFVSDGSTLTRVQDAWAEVRDAYDLDLRSLVPGECAREDRWACDLGIELALTVLEDEDLAGVLRERGETATVVTQDLAPLLAALATSSKPGATAKPVASRLFEVATTAGAIEHAPSDELAEAARAAGLIVTTADDGLASTIRIRPGSPLGRMVAAEVDPAAAAALAAIGLDLRALRSPAGLTIRAEEVDGLHVVGLPQDAPSKVAPALRGDADTLADSETYDEVVTAAAPPDEVGAYGFIDLKSYVEAVLTSIAANEPSVQRVIPAVRNNLADVPGIVVWSTREDSGGEQVGAFELAMPILE